MCNEHKLRVSCWAPLIPPCSPSPLLAFHFPLVFPFASILCAVCTVEWSLGRCKANACSCLAAVGCECEKANAKSAQCVGKGEGRGGEKRQLWKCNWDSFTQRWLCVDNDLCKVANLISCAPKNAARISTANGKMLTLPPPPLASIPPGNNSPLSAHSSPPLCAPSLPIFKWWH